MKHYRVTNDMIGVHSRGKLIPFGIMFEIRKDGPDIFNGSLDLDLYGNDGGSAHIRQLVHSSRGAASSQDTVHRAKSSTR